MDPKRKVVFTHHAIERLAESQLDEAGALELLRNATESPLNEFKDMRRYKAKKYKEQAKQYQSISPPLIFTVVEHWNDNPPGIVYVVITVYDQRLNMRYVC